MKFSKKTLFFTKIKQSKLEKTSEACFPRLLCVVKQQEKTKFFPLG
jgi:hypothetical protein